MIGVIIQARVGSVRFPGKILKKVCGKTLLEHEIERVKKSKLVKKLVLATTLNREDDVLEKIAKKVKIDFFRGSEEDVLDRYYQAASKFKMHAVVRITGDCPLIDARLIDDAVALFLKNKVSYVSNVDPPTFPDGMDVEVFSFDALKSAWKGARLPSEREHVTPYVRKHRKMFPRLNFKSDTDFSKLRLTLDYPRDLIVIRKIYKSLYPNKKYFGIDEIISLFSRNPGIFDLNRNISRNLGYKKSLRKDLKWLQ